MIKPGADGCGFGRMAFRLGLAAFLITSLASRLAAEYPGLPADSRLADSMGALNGYIASIPPELAEDRLARHQKIAQRRSGPIVIVHRGAWAVAPENTLEAYAAAMDYGADGCEIDIRRTADGVLVMAHDDGLDRMTDALGRINHYTYLAMDEATAGKSAAPLFEEATRAFLRQQITTEELEDLLRSTNSAVRGTAILACLDDPTGSRASSLRKIMPWTQELPHAGSR